MTGTPGETVAASAGEMVFRVAAAVAALASYYSLFWLAGTAIASVFPNASHSALVLVGEGAAIGAALPVGYLAFQHVGRMKVRLLSSLGKKQREHAE